MDKFQEEEYGAVKSSCQESAVIVESCRTPRKPSTKVLTKSVAKRETFTQVIERRRCAAVKYGLDITQFGGWRGEISLSELARNTPHATPLPTLSPGRRGSCRCTVVPTFLVLFLVRCGMRLSFLSHPVPV